LCTTILLLYPFTTTTAVAQQHTQNKRGNLVYPSSVISTNCYCTDASHWKWVI